MAIRETRTQPDPPPIELDDSLVVLEPGLVVLEPSDTLQDAVPPEVCLVAEGEPTPAAQLPLEPPLAPPPALLESRALLESPLEAPAVEPLVLEPSAELATPRPSLLRSLHPRWVLLLCVLSLALVVLGVAVAAAR